MESYKKEFIDFMLECGVLTFGDFVTKSGRKTPFFINTGNYRTGSALRRLGGFYAEAILQHFGTDFDVLFGPAYKGIPLAVTASAALSERGMPDVRYCANRKEVKDHGDKGILLGSPLSDGDRVVIIEDVTTAGTSVRETVPLLLAQADVSVTGLIVSVDRMERGTGNKGALDELGESFGIQTAAIVTMEEVISCLKGKEIGGKVLLDDEMMDRIRAYYEIYGARE